ncbi:MAG: hypothetical protein U0T77_11695 [Chitinophagales bacterium]
MKKILVLFSLWAFMADGYAQFRVIEFNNTANNLYGLKKGIDSSITLHFSTLPYSPNPLFYNSKDDNNWSPIDPSITYNMNDYCIKDKNHIYAIAYGDETDSATNYVYEITPGALAIVDSIKIRGDINQKASFGLVHFYNANDGVILSDGAPNAIVYTTNNGGAIWNRVSDSNIPSSTFCGFFTGADRKFSSYKDTSWAIAFYYNYTNSVNIIYKTTNKGVNWQKITIPSNLLPHVLISEGNQTSQISFKNGREGIFCVVDSSKSLIFLKTTDGGLNWSTLSTAGLPSGVFNNIFPYLYYASNGYAYLSWEGYGLYVSANNGMTWVHYPGLNTQVFTSVKENNGKIYLNDFYNKKLYINTAAGILSQSAFKSIDFPDAPSFFSNIRIALDNSVWLEFSDNNNNHTYYYSYNDSIWTKESQILKYYVYDFDVIDSNHIVQINNNIYTSDSTTNYIYNSRPGYGPTNIKRLRDDINKEVFADYIHFFNRNDGIIICDGSSNMVVYRTADGGDSWTKVPNGNLPAGAAYFITNRYQKISAIGDTLFILPYYYFGNNIDKIFKSTDKGLHWSVVQVNISLIPSVISNRNYESSSISFKNAREGIYCVVDTNYNIALLKTVDGGITWNKINYTELPNQCWGYQYDYTPYLIYSQ